MANLCQNTLFGISEKHYLIFSAVIGAIEGAESDRKPGHN